MPSSHETNRRLSRLKQQCRPQPRAAPTRNLIPRRSPTENPHPSPTTDRYARGAILQSSSLGAQVLSKRRLTPQTQRHFTTHTRTLEPDISAYVLFGGLENFQHGYFRSFPDR